ncbi:unnamed protein product [Tilletia laevis]|nr:unnamed protein product [Tilletia caries]CAD6939968.1 unnamed protein product [Tilletia laevis]
MFLFQHHNYQHPILRRFNMTRAALELYSPQLFQSLLPIEAADCGFNDLGGLDKIGAALCDVAKKHPTAAANLGLQLLHRHADLDSDEILVGYGATTLPIKRSPLSSAALSMLHPTTWGLDLVQNRFVPLEFAFAKDGAMEMPEDLDFDLSQDFANIIYKFGLERTVGLALVDPNQQPGLEITHGRANIVIPATILVPSDRFVEVLWPLWTFSKDPKAHKTCFTACYKTFKGEHVEVHEESEAGRS